MATSTLDHCTLQLAAEATLSPLGSLPYDGALLRLNGDREALLNGSAATLLGLCDGLLDLDEVLLYFVRRFPELAGSDADARRFLERALTLGWLQRLPAPPDSSHPARRPTRRLPEGCLRGESLRHH